MPKVYKPARTSISPMILPDRKTERAYKTVEVMPERVTEGYKLVALEATTIVLDFIKRNAPIIDDDDYSARLEPVYSVSSDGTVNVSIIGENLDRKTNAEDATSIAFLYAKGMLEPKTAKAYEVLRKYQPWPVGLYPLPTGGSNGIGLAIRKVSGLEYQAQTLRINKSKSRIEGTLRSLGFDVNIATSSEPKTVQTDLAFAILQVEYGIGRKADSHWRTAISRLKREIGVLQGKFKRFIAEGRESIFVIDNTIIEVSKIKDLDSQLQERVAQSTGLKVEKQ